MVAAKFEAKYPGVCADCRDDIVPGERVTYNGDDELVHDGHGDRPRVVIRRPSEIGDEVCPSCCLIHAGECF